MRKSRPTVLWKPFSFLPISWSAIVRGAVMSQLPSEASVTSNVAPKHYGVSARSIYDPIRDANEKKHYDRYEDVYRVDKMTWYIQKGDDLLRARKIVFPFYRTWEPNPSHSDLQIEETLLQCDLDQAPEHPKEGKGCLHSSAFRHCLAPADRANFFSGVVVKNCTLKTDLSVVPVDAFKKRSRAADDGEEVKYWELHYKLLVTIHSGPMLFSIVSGGKEYGQVGTDY